MNKLYKHLDWSIIFRDYFSGMSEREIMQKYDISVRTIQRYCKYIMIHMLNNPNSIFNENWEKIKKEISKIIG